MAHLPYLPLFASLLFYRCPTSKFLTNFMKFWKFCGVWFVSRRGVISFDRWHWWIQSDETIFATFCHLRHNFSELCIFVGKLQSNSVPSFSLWYLLGYKNPKTRYELTQRVPPPPFSNSSSVSKIYLAVFRQQVTFFVFGNFYFTFGSYFYSQ